MKPEIEYTYYKISKGNGKFRHINAPSDALKEYQSNLLMKLYEILPHDSNHGFIPGRSIVTNATPHVGKEFVLSMDIKDFFPNTTTEKVEEIFNRFFPQFKGDMDICLYRGHIPQGAPTSPYIANFALYDFDITLSQYCEKHQANYTRYADDITISFEEIDIKTLLTFVNTELAKYKYRLSFKKTHLMHRSRRQKVTGIIVNEKLNIPREIRNQLRAYNHLIKNNKFHPGDIQWVMGLNGYDKMTELK